MNVVELAYFLVFLLFYILVAILVITQLIHLYTPEVKYSTSTPEGLYFMTKYYFLNNNNFTCKLIGINKNFYFCKQTNKNPDIYIIGYKDYTLFNDYTRVYVFDDNVNISDICLNQYKISNNAKICKYNKYFIFVVNFSNLTAEDETIVYKFINNIYRNIYYISIPKFLNTNETEFRIIFGNIINFLNIYPCVEVYSNVITRKPTITLIIEPENSSLLDCYLCIRNQISNIYNLINISLYGSDIEPLIFYNFSYELPIDIYNTLYYNCSKYCGNTFKYEYQYNYINLGRCWKKEFSFYRIYRSPKLPEIYVFTLNNTVYVELNISIISFKVWC